MKTTTYNDAMVEVKDMVWEAICKANTIERKAVETIARKYNVVITDDDYKALKEEWEEV